MSQDPLYALNELFRFVASSENQYLSLLQSRIDDEMRFVGVDNQLSLLNLAFIKGLLEKHLAKLAENAQTLAQRDFTDWPKSNDATRAAEAEKAAKALLTDFDYLQSKTQRLLNSCRIGAKILTSNSVMAESQISENKAEHVRKLTIIASFFVPLSFACSFFGMNFKEFGQGQLGMWVYGAVAGPLTILTCALVFQKLPDFIKAIPEHLRPRRTWY